MNWTELFWIWVGLMNGLTFLLYGYDKRCARKGAWRVPEWQLLLSAACFGSVGALLAMNGFRHKPKHAKFVIGVPVLRGLQILTVVKILFLP
ncbi:DUF1294 domain-containing protein [Acidaminococcus timonensis]|uniref:DUF1294 domain-containing protein n=1 Tax=Acidaminococcus timonensis TaxID=1871002 RepID=UPI00307B2ABB